jgi:hypothetical protein
LRLVTGLVDLQPAGRPPAAVVGQVRDRRRHRQRAARSAAADALAAGAATIVQAFASFGLSQLLGVAAQRAITDMRRRVQSQ